MRINYKRNQMYARGLISAIEKNDLEKLDLLLKKSGNINSKPYLMNDMRNDSALIYAAELGNLEAAKMLCEKGAKLDIVGTNGQTPLLWALKSFSNNKYEVARFLVEKGANIELRNIHRNAAIGELIECKRDSEYKKFDFFLYLLEKGASLEGTSFGHAILDATLYNDVKIVDYLINEKGIDINLQIEGLTPLMMTAYRDSNKDICEYLLQNGANKSLVNKNNETALDMAISYNTTVIIELLKNE